MFYKNFLQSYDFSLAERDFFYCLENSFAFDNSPFLACLFLENSSGTFLRKKEKNLLSMCIVTSIHIFTT